MVVDWVVVDWVVVDLLVVDLVVVDLVVDLVVGVVVENLILTQVKKEEAKTKQNKTKQNRAKIPAYPTAPYAKPPPRTSSDVPSRSRSCPTRSWRRTATRTNGTASRCTLRTNTAVP